MTETTVIDPLAPIALLDVDNVLDNELFKWCADEVMDSEGNFLEDKDLTYANFEITPATLLPAGTTVVMPYLWGYGARDMTKPTDYKVTLPSDATAAHVVHVILSAYHGELEAAGGSGRFFFIEEVRVNDNGDVEVSWGT